MKKIGGIALLSLLLATSCADVPNEPSIDYQKQYGENFKIENKTANQDYLYGMCDLAWSEYSWTGIDYTMTSKLINNLGVKSVRNWMHCNWMMKDPNTFDEKNLQLSKDIVADLQQYNYQIIGMNHSNFHKQGLTNSSSTVAKPARDLSEGSYYLQWLNDYETTWFNIVSQFPSITYWEIDNEPNNDVFFPKLTGGNFTLKEKAAIYTDMMYFASKGIHRANKDAITVMGGLVIGTAETFLQYIYDNIKADDSWSNYPDDYFQVACWHPYMDDFTESKFERTNNDIYSVIKENEGKDKKVFFTEFGFSEVNVSPEKITENISKVYNTIKTKLPYVESCHYFRMYDNLGSNWGASSEKYFGLFTDPKEHGVDGSNVTLAAPKASAKEYQKMTGGSGSLTLYQEVLNNL